jgi:hypothetical protein
MDTCSYREWKAAGITNSSRCPQGDHNLTPSSEKQRSAYELAGLCFLLIVLSLQLFFSVRRESQTWDEANHIFCGYRIWTHSDFGLNPEHPPLVKLLATAPLLWSQWKTPALEERFFKEDAFLRGKEFLYQNDPEKILSRTRTAAAALALLTALVVFFSTREMFGRGAAFIALTLLTVDPNLLAHGALVTTDVGFACFMLLSVYTFYRFVKSPSALRLFMVGASVGLALAVKHTGVLILPILFLLALSEIIVYRVGINRALKTLGSLALIALIGWVILWSFYKFRYDARPDGLQLNPPLAEYVKGLEPHEAWPISAMARVRALPESYLYGMADIKLLYELRAWQSVCTQRLVLLPGYVSDQVNRRCAGAFSVKSRGCCNASSESWAGDLVSAGSDSRLLNSCTDYRDEHRRAACADRLCVSIRAYRWCCLGVDPEESEVGLRCWSVIARARGLIFNGVSKLHRVRK